MFITTTRDMTTLKILLLAVALFAMATAEAADAKTKATAEQPVSLGAYFGPLDQFQPNAKVQVVYAEGDVSFIPLHMLEAEKRSPAHFIHQTRHEQIVRLLELAKKLAIKYKTPAYAVSNLRVNTSFTSHEIIVETWGDLLAVRPPP